MRRPSHHRPKPRKVLSPLEIQQLGFDLEALASRVGYVGSVEHKDHPSFAGHPAPRADATKCDPDFAGKQDQINEWLQEAIRQGNIGAPVYNGFPQYVWYKDGDRLYQARLINCVKGEYKGFELTESQFWPEGI